MQGVIIIDEQQLVINNATDVFTSFAADKFTVRIVTATNEFHDGLTEDQLLETIIGEGTSSPSEPSPHVGIEFDNAKSTKTSGVTEVASPPQLRVVVEPPPASPRSTFASSVMGMKTATANTPSTQGILMEGAPKPAVGQEYPLTVEQAHVVSVLRNEFEVVVIRAEDALKKEYPIVKGKGLIRLKSSPFTALFGDAFRLGVHTLVTVEQSVTHGHDRENFLCIEEAPKVIIDALVDESAGTGTFHLEEVVSVYENPVTNLTKVDNGKD